MTMPISPSKFRYRQRRRAHDLTAVRVQRRDRLVEVGRRRLRASPGTPPGGSRSSDARRRPSSAPTGGRWIGSSSGMRPAVRCDELVALARDRGRHAVEQDAPRLHRDAAYDRRRVGAARIHAAAHAGRARVDRAEPAVALLRRRAHDRVPDRSRERRGPAAAGRRSRRRRSRGGRDHLGRLAVVLGLVRGAARPGAFPVQGSLRRRALQPTRGEMYSRCVYIWVDKDFALAARLVPGLSEEARADLDDAARRGRQSGPEARARRARSAPRSRRTTGASPTSRSRSRGRASTGGFVNALPMLHTRFMPNIDPSLPASLDELVTMRSRDVEVGPVYTGEATVDLARRARRRAREARARRDDRGLLAPGRRDVRRRHLGRGAILRAARSSSPPS